MDTKALLAMLPQVISLIGEAAKLTGAAGAVPKYLDLLSTIVGQGAAAYDELKALRALVVQMVQQKREPLPDEWTALEVRSDTAHDRIQRYNFEDEQPAGEPATLV